MGIFKKLLKQLSQFTGYDIKIRPIGPTNTDKLFMEELLKKHNINLVIDVGANKGQFVDALLETHYSERIISFEPIKEAYLELLQKYKNISNFSAFNFALGNENKKISLNISKNSVSSSFFDITKRLSGDCNCIKTELCNIKRLDSFYDIFKGKNIFLKIDVQGYEKEVLKGAPNTLKNTKIISMEMSFVELYKNQPLFIEMVNFLDKKGFGLYSINSALANDSTGQILQVDGIFLRKEYL